MLIILIMFADVDECLDRKVNCQDNSVCVNTNGSYNCKCFNGYFKDGDTCVGKSTKICFEKKPNVTKFLLSYSESNRNQIFKVR